MHPAGLRCSSLTYARYARSSRLAGRAPRRPEMAHLFPDGPLSDAGRAKGPDWRTLRFAPIDDLAIGERSRLPARRDESLGLLVEIIEPVTIGARIGLLVIGAPPCALTSTGSSSARAADGSTSGRSCRRSAGTSAGSSPPPSPSRLWRFSAACRRRRPSR
jgi:hypothetical protein